MMATLWNFVVCLAITALPFGDCKEENVIPMTTENPVTHHGILSPKNETADLQKNNTDSSMIVKQNEPAVAKHINHLETHRNPKTRQVSATVPVQTSYPSPTFMGDMNAEHSFYHSPLMVYPFPMMNTYYPRYFPYTYPGYQGHPFFG